jgi:hypothetical protein
MPWQALESMLPAVFSNKKKTKAIAPLPPQRKNTNNFS